MLNRYFFLLLLISSLAGFSQSIEQEVLFSIDDEPVYVGEFERVYKKNLDLVKDESQKDVDEYLKLFINYKLKLKEAYAMGLDEKPSYQRELMSYRKQLANNFLTDTHVTEELVKEAYNNTIEEVNVSHILVRVDENASPEDTLKAYNQIVKLRDRALTEGFDKVKNEVHNGQTLFGEDLGYFTAFKMVYNFEKEAFKTPVGEISKPFRTRFGYHILEVKDKRQSRGQVKVAHIMVSLQKDGKPNEMAEERIQDIYKKLQQGEDFEAVAKQFSDDKSSSNRGGILEPFSSGQLSSSEFEEQAFALKNSGDISEPFKTQFGWHIIKLYDKYPVKSFEELKPELESKVKRDSRSQLINESLVNDLKVRYGITERPNLDYFVSIINDNFFNRTWTLPEDFQGNKPLVKIDKKQFTYADFGELLVNTQKRPMAKQPYETLINNLYDSFLGAKLKQYREDNLENEDAEFAQIVGEYRDGLLLFDLMESKIWNVAKTDSTEIQQYYQDHKDNYFWGKRAEATVASCSLKKDAKEVASLLKEGKTPDEIKTMLNKEGQVNVIFTSGLMEEDDKALPEGYKFQLGQSKIYKDHNSHIIVQVSKIIPKEEKSFDDAKGLILSDYQLYKEEKWLDALKKKYNISIDQEVLNKVKSDLKS